MQQEMFIQYEDFSEEEIGLGISGGINSAALAVWLSQWPENLKPKAIHIFYAHFEEHSPDTYAFVKDLIRFCKRNFKKVYVKITRNSVLRFFYEQKMIPHPMIAPCTRLLKVIPWHEYMKEHNITIDLVGYVREEIKRVRNMAKKTDNNVDGRSIQLNDVKKYFPISDKTNEWCFAIVKKHIGWYPKIYTLRWNDKKFCEFMIANLYRLHPDSQLTVRKKLGTRERVVKHNNCLPCKNFQEDDYLAIEYFYPEYYKKSIKLANDLNAHWGRVLGDSDKGINELQFNLTFGRTEEETGHEKQSCGVCAFG